MWSILCSYEISQWDIESENLHNNIQMKHYLEDTDYFFKIFLLPKNIYFAIFSICQNYINIIFITSSI